MESQILFIDDDIELAENVRSLLMLAGYSVAVAHDGVEGVELATRLVPDLIICDIKMPGISGFDVFDLLHAHAATSSIPFIFLTGKSSLTDFRQGMRIGADDYITKPFDTNDLLRTIELRMRKHRLHSL